MPKQLTNGRWVPTKADERRAQKARENRRRWRKFAISPTDKIDDHATPDPASLANEEK